MSQPTYRSPLLNRPGAVGADPPDAGVAAHYGDPLREQRRLVAGSGMVDLSHRPVIRIAGPDRLTWLHSLTSQHLERLAPGVATTALILSPHGHVEHALALVDDGTAVWAHVEPGTAPPLLDYLERMRFWSDVAVADVSDAWAVVWEPAREPDASKDAASDSPYPTRVEPDPRPDTILGRELFLPREQLVGRAEGRELAGVWALEALRIAAGTPRMGRETDHRTIPHEVDWLRDAVHLDKGCYRGQETVARVHNLGRPPRRLVLLHLDGSADHLPEPGDPVDLEDRSVGRVTSSARHWELGPLALAVVKRSTPATATLLAGGVPAAQQVLVPA